MKLYAPRYYKNFKCIADKCKNSCCIGWEIDIDKTTLEKYKKLKNGYGATIMSTVSMEETPHFVLSTCERCPHLDENGLCKIIINEGEEYLSDICREHPRFYNYTSVCEVGLGISCEEAARVILSSPEYSSYDLVGEVDADFDGVEFDGKSEREEIYKILQEKTLSYIDRLDKIYKKYEIDMGNDECWKEKLDSLEYLDPKNKELFKNYSSKIRPDREETNEYLERFLAYFIYRHCTEAYDIYDFISRLSFCLFIERLLASLICKENAQDLNDTINLAIIISSEIEYSDENTSLLID